MNKMTKVFPVYCHGRRINIPTPEFDIQRSAELHIFGLKVLSDEAVARESSTKNIVSYLNWYEQTTKQISQRREQRISASR